MISDRAYMRANNPARELAPLLWLIGALVVGFLAQLGINWAFTGFTSEWLALTPENILRGRVWTLLTYSFLHDPSNLLHLVGNALGILFIGRLLLPAIGTRRFFLSYFGAVAAGGLFWLAVNFARPDRPVLIGASAGCFGLLALFCCRFAFERLTLLLFFIIPITVVPRYLLIVLGSVETLFFLFAELLPSGARTGIAHSAHVAGIIAGIIAHRAIRTQAEEDEPVSRKAIDLPDWMRKKSTGSGSASFKVDIAPRKDLKAEVDRILDKINTSGFGSLTVEEKRTLDEARNLMSKH